MDAPEDDFINFRAAKKNEVGFGMDATGKPVLIVAARGCESLRKNREAVANERTSSGRRNSTKRDGTTNGSSRAPRRFVESRVHGSFALAEYPRNNDTATNACTN